MKSPQWTPDGARLQYQSSHKNTAIQWLFLPGGPGLGSESLTDLTVLLKDKIPGAIWHVDLPNDGSNILKDKPISKWRDAILQSVSLFENVVLVAHSTVGMYVQTMPELEKMLRGLVLLGSAPDASWQKSFAEYSNKHKNNLIVHAEKDYIQHPNNDTLRELLIAAAKNCFVTEKSLIKGKKLFMEIPVNHLASEEASKSFDTENYHATWIPQKINTLITTGSQDYITPLSLYKNNKLYQRDNIMLKEISGAGHWPWFENPVDVVQAFEELALKTSK